MRKYLALFAAIAVALGSAPLAMAQTTGTATITPAPYAAPDREMMIPVEGGRVYVRINGVIGQGKTPAIFIHGGPGGTHDGFAQILGLANERPIILYDQLDSGKSDRPDNPKNWRVERFVDTLEIIRKKLGIERWHVVGHSWGSAIALEYAARYPDHIASTVLAGTYISTKRWIEDANKLVKLLPPSVQQTIAACDTKTPPSPDKCQAATNVFYHNFNGRVPASAAERAYVKRIGGQGFNPVIYNAMWGPSEFRSTGSLKNFDAVPLLKKLDGTRTMFLIGQYDEARIDTVQDYVAMTPHSELGVIPGAAHGIFNDRPMITEAILRSWFDRHDDQP